MTSDPTDTEDTGAEAGEAVPPDQEERIVSKVVERVKDFVATLSGGDGGGGEEGTGEAEPIETAPEPSTPRQVEAETEEAVRAALDKLRGEEEHKREHDKLRELERPPQVVSRLTKALWGEP